MHISKVDGVYIAIIAIYVNAFFAFAMLLPISHFLLKSHRDYRKFSGTMPNPASRIIEKCGGPKPTAEMVGVSISRVHRWTYSKERGGTGGIVPSGHQQRLLDEARKRGIPLEPADFFDLPDEG